MSNLVLVHLSDIHFTRSSGVSEHDLDTDVRNELTRDAEALTTKLGGATGVLITGDIAYSGQKEEYNQAAVWLREFCKKISCPEQNVSVVPGNHDIDRKLAEDKITKMIHNTFHDTNLDVSNIDLELKEFFFNSQSANALLAPLTEYNTFAARYGCSVSKNNMYWQRDLSLSCGTIIRLRGLCSVYISNKNDKKGKMILGTAQSSVLREEDVLHLTLCHHPPEWLLDQDCVDDHLKSRVHIQLFGHKHSQRVSVIDGMVRLIAGATHPERRERDWIPTYNVLEIFRVDDDNIKLHLFQRQWSKAETRFIPQQDSNSGKDYREYKWSGYPRREFLDGSEPTPQYVKRSETSSTIQDISKVELCVSTSSTSDHTRRLTFRFLTLPTLDQYDILRKLELLREEDFSLPRNTHYFEVFKRVMEADLLANFWDEIEKRHDVSASINPFINHSLEKI